MKYELEHGLRSANPMRVKELAEIYLHTLQNRRITERTLKDNDIIKPQGQKVKIRREATKLERNLCIGHMIWLDMVILCGLRPGETARIKYSDIGEGYMFVDGTKNKNAKRYVSLPAWMHDRIMLQPHTFSNEYVCKLTNNQRSRTFKKLLQEIGLPESDLEPYCFRHSYITDLENCPGYSQAAIHTIAGHSLVGVTDRYTHSRKETAASALPIIIGYWRSIRGFEKYTGDKGVQNITPTTQKCAI